MKQATIIGMAEKVLCVRSPSRSPVVIADGGDGAWIVEGGASEAPRVGARFSYRGQEWCITNYREHARAWVAELVRH